MDHCNNGLDESQMCARVNVCKKLRQNYRAKDFDGQFQLEHKPNLVFLVAKYIYMQ